MYGIYIGSSMFGPGPNGSPSVRNLGGSPVTNQNKNNLQPNRQHFNKTASTGNIMGNNNNKASNFLIKPKNQHFNKTASTGSLNVGGIHKRDKTKVFGKDPNVPAPPGGPNKNNNKNKGGLRPSNAQQNRPSNAMQNRASNANMTPQQRAMMMKQQQMAMASQRNLQQQRQNQHQRQVQRRGNGGVAWGPNHPWYRYYQAQRMMGQNAQRHPYYQQWMQYYQRMAQNPQGQLQQMVMQQQVHIIHTIYYILFLIRIRAFI